MPALLLRDLDELLRLFIFGTIATGVPFAVADGANFRVASFAFAIFASTFCINVLWFDPFPASSRRAIYSIAGRVLLELLVPFDFEFVVEEVLDMSKRYVFACTAPWRHMLRVTN